MKLVIASDIHGSAFWCRKLVEVVEAERPDRVVLLGDLLYHGPRNPLPRDYDPQTVAALLNDVAARFGVAAARGNCDAEVDQMLLDFPCMGDYVLLDDGGRTLFATHGHVFGPDNVPPHLSPSRAAKGGAGDGSEGGGAEPDAAFPAPIVLFGHVHVKMHDEADGVLFVNPGSVSLPKDGTHSCAVYENGAVRFVELGE